MPAPALLGPRTLFKANTRYYYLAQLGRKERGGFGNKSFVLVEGEKEEFYESVLEMGALLLRQLGTKPKTQEFLFLLSHTHRLV